MKLSLVVKATYSGSTTQKMGLSGNNNVILSYTRWFKYDRDYLCVNKSQFVPVIFEPPCIRQGTFAAVNSVIAQYTDQKKKKR